MFKKFCKSKWQTSLMGVVFKIIWVFYSVIILLENNFNYLTVFIKPVWCTFSMKFYNNPCFTSAKNEILENICFVLYLER